MVKAIFIDKDGVLVDNSGYPDIIPSDKLLENNILKGLKNIQEKGYKKIIVSNQPWISKGILSKQQVDAIFESVLKKLKEKEIIIEDYYYCPHHTADNCECKKPKPKMVLDAAKKHDIDINESFIVGDMDNEILLGKSIGLKTILVLTGNGKEFTHLNPDYIINDLNEINKII